jgi:glyceraldehyde 3-phosphate dehydrogenase
VTRVAINGFGRIGRNFLRACLEREPRFEVVAVNDLGGPRTMAHLLAFDSLLGPLATDVRPGDGTIAVGERASHPSRRCCTIRSRSSAAS